MDKAFKKVIFSGIALAMGIATLVLNILKQLESNTAITLLSIGLISLAILQLENK